MSPITLEEALQHVASTDAAGQPVPDDVRQRQAEGIVAGVAANDIYWSHSDLLTQLRAIAAGHGQVHSEEAGNLVNQSGLPAAGQTTTQTQQPPAGQLAPASSGGTPEVVNATESVAKLRQQLADAGITPEA